MPIQSRLPRRVELAGTDLGAVELVGHASCVTLRRLHQPEAAL